MSEVPPIEGLQRAYWRVQRIPRTELLLLAIRDDGSIAGGLVLDAADARALSRVLERESRRLRRSDPGLPPGRGRGARAATAAA